MSKAIELPIKTEEIEFSSSDFLRAILSDPKALKQANNIIELMSGLALYDVSNPQGSAVEPNANTNSRVPLTCGMLLAYEKRINELLGICEEIGQSLYPPMTYFSVLIHKYLRLTPSVQGNRADKVLEVLGGGGAIARMPDIGTNIDMGDDELPDIETKKKEDTKY